MAAWISVLLHLRLLGALPGPTEREVKLKRGGDTGTNYPLPLVAIHEWAARGRLPPQK